MTPVGLRALTKALATWLAAATSLVFAFSRFLPSGRPRGYSFVDDSWTQMLHMAFAERLQFGRGVVFSFGPWGFLYGGYPATYCFLLSPVVENRQSFFALASTNWQHELAGLEVTSARISTDRGRRVGQVNMPPITDQLIVASRYQSPPVRVRFYRLDFQRQDLGQTP